jgi:hypothetical protein
VVTARTTAERWLNMAAMMQMSQAQDLNAGCASRIRVALIAGGDISMLYIFAYSHIDIKQQLS